MHTHAPRAIRLVLAGMLAIAMASPALGQQDAAQDAQGAQAQERPRLEDPDGRFSVPIPTDWQAEQQDGYGVLTSPAGGIEIFVLALDETDLREAIEQAWQRVEPEFDLAVDQTQSPPPSGEIEEQLVISYDSAQDRVVQAVAQLHEGAAYLLLVDAELTAVQQRTSQLQIVQSGFQIAAIQETDLSGEEAGAIDAELLADLESYIRDSLDAFEVPGAAVAIVREDEIVWTEGFGVRDVETGAQVGPETLMMIGSVTKTMTTMLMADLVARGAMDWSTPVDEILPEFQVSDPELTERFLVRHLVCACTGVPRRDLELVFNSAQLSAEDVVRSLAGFEFFTDFGEAFQYSNQLVATGGYVAAAAAGTSFGSLYQGYLDAMHERILGPIGMAWSTFSFESAEARTDRATPYGIDASFELLPLPLSAERFVTPVAPAGALWSNAIDMGRYLITQIRGGVAPAGVRVVAEESLARTWEPQVSVSDTASYGLGWIVGEYQGVEVLSHGGNTFGFTADLAFLPDAEVGIVVLANRRNANAFAQAVRVRLFEALYGQPYEYDEQARFQHQQLRDQVTQTLQDTEGNVDPETVAPFVGTYTNDALGQITISLTGDRLLLDAGEFSSRLLPSSQEDQPDTYLLTDPPLLGLPVELVRSDDGTPSVVLGRGAVEYTFAPAEDAAGS